ncbi:MAG TPA: dihydrodipicolinate synthase family protein [Roseimicrobium sp.]|nr:dihydrodipicolinate synthase family protein [Roseimicrobium sp.]
MSLPSLPELVSASLMDGVVIPACPLALDSNRKLDERRQRALIRYYAAAGVGGLAVGVHTTQFAIRDPKHGLFEPVLRLAQEELNRADKARRRPMIRVGGVCGPLEQALKEAALIRGCGYHAALLNLGALSNASDDEMIRHCTAVSEILPLFGFYLQPSVGGRQLPYAFWRRFMEIDNICAIKIAPFNRYQTLDVMRAAAESGRRDVALYTGNDDNIVLDLLLPYRFGAGDDAVERRMMGGLLGHWAVWTKPNTELVVECHRLIACGGDAPGLLMRRATEITDCNAAFFDAANGYAGCIAGLHEVLRRQGLLEGIWCLDPSEGLSPGQMEEIDRVYKAYPHLNDDAFVAANRDKWLEG